MKGFLRQGDGIEIRVRVTLCSEVRTPLGFAKQVKDFREPRTALKDATRPVRRRPLDLAGFPHHQRDERTGLAPPIFLDGNHAAAGLREGLQGQLHRGQLVWQSQGPGLYPQHQKPINGHTKINKKLEVAIPLATMLTKHW